MGKVKFRALVLNGPNLNLLGTREPGLYGKVGYVELVGLVEKWARDLGGKADCIQSGYEGELLEYIHTAPDKYDFMVINPGAYTHTSIAIRDAIASISIPCIEVHITNIYRREDFRRVSMISAVCEGVISGLGIDGYNLALQAGGNLLQSRT